MISIIIPTFNEAEIIERTLSLLTQQQGSYEIIVSDNSTDATAEIAQQYATVVTGGTTRAEQMNKGAAVAKGDVLLFLHADTVLPYGALEILENEKNKFSWGAFYQQFTPTTPFLRFISWRSNTIRLKYFQIAYGDQAIFVTAKMFHHVEGYNLIPLLEDLELSHTLRSRAKPFIIKDPVITSSRRFITNGVLRTYCNMLLLLFYYHVIGISPARLARMYK